MTMNEIITIIQKIASCDWLKMIMNEIILNKKIIWLFRVRPGTVDKGRNYENLNLAAMVLKLVEDEAIKNFQISSNDDDFGDFDDIVAEIETNTNDVKILALQLKHNDRGNIGIERLTKASGDFSIKKYFNSFQKTKSLAQCFLFTNLKFQVKNESNPFNIEGEEFQIKVSKLFPEDVLSISETDYCFKFHLVDETVSPENCEKASQYKTFFENFFLYSDQGNLEQTKINVVNNFKKLFLGNESESERFVNLISEWSLQKGLKLKLNKQWMQRAIALEILSSRIDPLIFEKPNEKKKILRDAISSFNITIFENSGNNMVTGLWGDIKEQLTNISVKRINELRIQYRLSSTYITEVDKLDSHLISKLSWLLGLSPLILRKDSTVCKGIELCLDEKFVILSNNSVNKLPVNSSVFKSLSDLQNKNEQFENVIKNFTCSIQGKKEITLDYLLQENPELLTIIKTDHLLKMLDIPYKILGEKEILPEPYIERHLIQNFIDVKYLQVISKNTFILIDHVTNVENMKMKFSNCEFINLELEGYEDENVKNAGLASSIYYTHKCCDFFEFQKKCIDHEDKNITNYHQFRLYEEGKLEWIRSRGDVSELENYKLFQNVIEEKKLWISQPHNNINFITGGPGMGKSQLLKSLKNNCPSNFCTIILNPEDIFSFYQKIVNNYLDVFDEYILREKFENSSCFDKIFLNISIKKKNIIYVWDALDELSNEHLEIVTKLMNELAYRSRAQWVTSRNHLQTYLQQKFEVLSINMTQFDYREQAQYIKKRLKDVENIEEIGEKIQSTFHFVEHTHILGVPLQIFLLTELFRQNSNKYFDLLSDSFVLTDLYDYFLQEKCNLYFRDKMKLKPQNFRLEILINKEKNKILNIYRAASLITLFSKNILERFDININTQIVVQKVKKYIQVGIITDISNENLRFIHHSFVEYLVALYLYQNCKKFEDENSLSDVIFDPRYTNVRFFFDLILAGKCLPQIFVLYKNSKLLKNCDDETLKCGKDLGGRSALHLACSWGQRRPPLTVSEKGNKYIVDDNGVNVTPEEEEHLRIINYLLTKCDVYEQDLLFGMKPIEYAQRSHNIRAEISILKENPTLLDSNDINYICNLLYYSARLGFDEVFRLSVLENKMISLENTWGETLIFIAALNGYEKIVQFLAENGADPNHVRQDGATPLYIASQNGHVSVVGGLISKGADVNFARNTGDTPLYIASHNGHVNVVELLTAKGGDLDVALDDGATPLYIASQNGHVNVVELLIAKGADLNLARNTGATPLYIASQNGHVNITKLLIAKGNDLNRACHNGATPLFIASQNGHFNVVELLIAKGADFNLACDNGTTPLYIASQKGHFNIVELLIAKGVDLNLARKSGDTPLYIASQNGYLKVAELLIAKGSDLNRACDNGAAPLFIASQNGHVNVVELLIAKGGDLNFACDNGATPLYIASQKRHINIVELLIAKGADLNLARNTGGTPLYIASQNGHVNVAELLISKGSDLNRACVDDATPLFIASQNGHVNVVDLLTAKGADLNHARKGGATPLYIASHMGHINVVEVLISRGANLNLAFNSGATPLDTASRNGHVNVVELLIAKGAKRQHQDCIL